MFWLYVIKWIFICIYPLRMDLILRELLKINILASGVMRKFDFIYWPHSQKLSENWGRNWLLSRNRTSLTKISRKRTVEAVFLSVLDICDRNAAPSTLKPLDTVHHSALWFITGDSYCTHHCILYDKVGRSSLAERCNKHWYLFIY